MNNANKHRERLVFLLSFTFVTVLFAKVLWKYGLAVVIKTGFYMTIPVAAVATVIFLIAVICRIIINKSLGVRKKIAWVIGSIICLPVVGILYLIVVDRKKPLDLISIFICVLLALFMIMISLVHEGRLKQRVYRVVGTEQLHRDGDVTNL